MIATIALVVVFVVALGFIAGTLLGVITHYVGRFVMWCNETDCGCAEYDHERAHNGDRN